MQVNLNAQYLHLVVPDAFTAEMHSMRTASPNDSAAAAAATAAAASAYNGLSAVRARIRRPLRHDDMGSGATAVALCALQVTCDCSRAAHHASMPHDLCLQSLHSCAAAGAFAPALEPSEEAVAVCDLLLRLHKDKLVSLFEVLISKALAALETGGLAREVGLSLVKW